MTPDEALEVMADEVTCTVLREMIENGLCDSYLDAELRESSSNALRERLSARAAGGPAPATLVEAVRIHARVGGS